jgi:hypothetical protein
MMRAATFKALSVVLFIGLGSRLLIAFADTKSQAAQILEESYLISRHLPSQERAFFLVRLVDVSTGVSPHRTEAWSKELLDLAPTLAPDWNRVAVTKNALVPLSKVNPARALDLLSQVEKPIRQDGALTEDVRADAAVQIFLNYFNTIGIKGLENIMATADAIGKTGEYPHRAIGILLQESVKAHIDDKLLTEMFTRAVNYYDRGSDFQDEDEQFFELLQRAESVVPAPLFKRGVEKLVEHLTSTKSKKHAQMAAEVHTADGAIFPFDSQKKLLLFRVFPTLSRLDRERAIELVKQYPWLANAGSEVRAVAASAIPDAPLEANTAEVHQEMDEKLALRRISHLKETNPASALANARLLPLTSSARPVALSLIIPKLIPFDAAQAQDAYNELQGLIEKLPEGTPKLRGLVAAAKAAFQMHDLPHSTTYTFQAFDYGLKIANADTPANRVPVACWHLGYPELVDIAEFGGEHAGTEMLARIRSLQDDGMRAFLLVYASKGLSRSTENTVRAAAMN